VPDYLLPSQCRYIVILVLARSRVLAPSVFTGWAGLGPHTPSAIYLTLRTRWLEFGLGIVEENPAP
jgi:hypothetical protein